MAKTTRTPIVGGNLMAAVARIGMRDVLVSPDTADMFFANISRFADTDVSVDGPSLEVASREALELAYGYEDSGEDRKAFVFQDGNAVIPIHGTLINRFNSSWGFVTGYNYIRRMYNAALDDDDVETIIFDVDSPGGEASGCFELAREIMAGRRVKPSLAMVDSLAASGGMALAGCATKMYAIPSARIGSIGVYRMHISYEEMFKKEGIKVTFASAGEHKVDGNPYQDLPDDVLKEWRESAGKTWDDFISLVAEARDMEESDVKATQARIYRADEALALGLINAVKTTTEAVSAFVAELADDDPISDDEEEVTMDKKTPEVTSGLTAADKADIARIAAEAAGTVVATIMGGVERKQSIKDYAASKGKGFVALGASLAADEAITLESAKTIIDAAAPVAAVAPKGKQRAAAVDDEDGDDEDGGEGEDEEGDDEDEAGDEATGLPKAKAKGKVDKVNHFDRAMANSKHPNVGGGKGKKGGDEAMSDEDIGASILADAAMGGAGWAKGAVKGNA